MSGKAAFNAGDKPLFTDALIAINFSNPFVVKCSSREIKSNAHFF
jgi:hypothetical protein